MKRSVLLMRLMLGLLLVLGIAFSCLTVGNSLFPKSLRRAREARLKFDLAHMRKSIDDYTRDRQQAPQSLQEPCRWKLFARDSHGPINAQEELGASFRHCETRQ